MASSNIKLFDENKGNMISDSEFSISNQRLNGLQTGVASSQLQNKAMYQASLVAYAIAQVMMQNGLNANDTDAVSTFVANLSSTMLQKVHDIATTEEAQAGVATGKWMSPALVKAAIDVFAAKAQNVLSDATKVLYGLNTTAVPDDVFTLLSRFQKGLGNEYLWDKVQVTDIVKDTGKAGEIVSTMGAVSNTSVTVTVYPSYEVNADGTFTLTGAPMTITGSYVYPPSLTDYIGYFNSSAENTELLEITSSSSAKNATSGSGKYGFLIANCKKYIVGKSAEHIGYVNSPDTNAYPPAVSDGYIYTALGQLGAKVQTIIGSYIGTGTHGYNNPNKLTFNFKPKIVFISTNESTHTERSAPYIWGDKELLYNNQTNNDASVSDNTLSWYHPDGAQKQFNISGQKYFYVAIG